MKNETQNQKLKTSRIITFVAKFPDLKARRRENFEAYTYVSVEKFSQSRSPKMEIAAERLLRKRSLPRPVIYRRDFHYGKVAL